MRVLIVEDDRVMARQIQRGLERHGLEADVAHDGESGLAMARQGSFAVVLLDWMLPKLPGVEVCRLLRLERNRAAVIMLTARVGLNDRVEGLDVGADDYVTKPFEMEELLARIRAVMRRGQAQRAEHLDIQDLEINCTAHTVSRAGVPIKLTKREFALLEAMARHPGRVFTRETIIEQIWEDDRSLSNTVNFHVTSLRKKIDSGREQSLIRTIHGVGYALETGGGGS